MIESDQEFEPVNPNQPGDFIAPPCPIPITYVGLGYRSLRTWKETRYGRTEEVSAEGFSDISQSDANDKALAEAKRLVARKFTHLFAPVGSRQLMRLNRKW